MERQRPAHVIRLGRIKAVIWANSGLNGVWYSVQVARVYKDQSGQWQQSDSFGRDDLLLAGKALDQAHTWVCEQNRTVQPEENGCDSANVAEQVA